MYAFGDKKMAIFLYYLKRLGHSELTKFASWIVCHGVNFVSLFWPNGKCHRNSKMSLWTLICVHLLWNYQKLKSARIREKILLIHVTLIKVKLRVKLLPKIIFWNLLTPNSSILEVFKTENSEKKIDISANK